MIFGEIERKGFCRGCVQNIRQKREIRNLLLKCVDYLFLRAPALLQFGPWHCPYCGNVRYFLSSPVQGVRDFEADQKNDSNSEARGPVGNFLKGQMSIVGKNGNNDRFSPKFRHGIARRLLKGQVTISQVCREINVNERDLMSWTNDYVLDQQKTLATEIAKLQFQDEAALIEYVEDKGIGDSGVFEPMSDASSQKGSSPNSNSNTGNRERSFPPAPKFSSQTKQSTRLSDSDEHSGVIEGTARRVAD